MKDIKNFFSTHPFTLLAIGKTSESTEAGNFKRYIGYGASKVVAVNPTKKELDEIFGGDAKEPEYVKDGENGKEATVTFIVKTDPDSCGGIETVNRLMFTLRNTPAYNRDQTKVQVRDDYGNFTWANVEDAKAGKALFSSAGNPLMIDSKYQMARQGEEDLVNFLKKFLNVGEVFDYKDGSWVKKDNASDYIFYLEKINDYFKGDFSEIKEIINLQPNNKVKLLYGVRTTDDGHQYQAIAAREGLVLRNNAGSKAFEKAERILSDMKARGSYPTTELKVQELTEYKVEATDFSAPDNTPTSDNAETPWG